MNCIKIVFSGLRVFCSVGMPDLTVRQAEGHRSADRTYGPAGRQWGRNFGALPAGRTFMIGRPNHHDRQTDHPDRPADRELPGVQKRCDFFSAVLILFLGRFWETLNLDITGNMKCSIHTGLRTWRWILHEEGYSLRIQGWRIDKCLDYSLVILFFLFSRVEP